MVSYSSHLNILQCPITGEELMPASEKQLQLVNSRADKLHFFTDGLVNKTNQHFYPVANDILFLLPADAIFLVGNMKTDQEISFDRQRIFNYFSGLGYYEYEGRDIYEDAKQFVDFRPFLQQYISKGFQSAGAYLPVKGQYFVDVASGPVAFKEYVALSNGYECRICIDLSANALLHARKNLEKVGHNYLLIRADMLHLPLRTGVADAVLCQHALFHVPKNDQLAALRQMVRIARNDQPVAIVYDWFYHSWFMNIMLGPVQIYRIVRHVIGKWYSRLFRKNNLYFYPHSPGWFRRNNPGNRIDFYVWRSVNIYFSKIYFHKNAFGKRMLKWVMDLEKKHPRLMGRIGEYAIILIHK